MPFKLQQVIDDTLFNILGKDDLRRLIDYEQKIFSQLELNMRSITNKL